MPIVALSRGPDFTALGWFLIAGAALTGLVTAFVLRRRLPAAFVMLLLAASGFVLAGGAMYLRPRATLAEVWVATISMAFLVPFHVRRLLGRFGPPTR